MYRKRLNLWIKLVNFANHLELKLFAMFGRLNGVNAQSFMLLCMIVGHIQILHIGFNDTV